MPPSRPTSDSAIKIEVWMSSTRAGTASWQAVGNGRPGEGCDRLVPRRLPPACAAGHAAAGDRSWATKAGAPASRSAIPRKLIDFGYRAADEMTIAAKAVIATYYGRAPKFSYWTGCSAGGRSAMMEAQRYPSNYDGIIAGSPGLNWTGRALLAIWIA